jgi:prepilin-type N-terminal cleavage/methylation domain-containing protein
MRKLCSRAGFTLLEVLIALFLTGVLSTAAFRFYCDMNNHCLTQEEISDMQQNSRATLQELSRTLRMAGYKIGTHVPYKISNDSLWVFFSDSLPVDTVLYYLEDEPSVDGGESQSKNLMRKRNSNDPALFTEHIEGLSYSLINSSTVEIRLEVKTTKADENFAQADGFRTIELAERVHLRNVRY